MNRHINWVIRRIALTCAGSCVISACAAPLPWTVILSPSPGQFAGTRYVKVSGVWRPAQYFPRPPPTESLERWGFAANCRPSIKISALITDGSIELSASQPPPATLIYNPRKIVGAAIERIVDESSNKRAECARLFQVESLNISWDMAPSGMGYWDGEFEVRLKLALIDNGEVVSTHTSLIKLIGMDSSSTDEQARLTSIAGNDTVYAALAEGIENLLSAR